MFIVDRVILRLLTQTSLPGGPICRPLRCVVCTSETAYFGASVLATCFLYCVSTCSESGLGTFATFFFTFASSLISRP